MVQQRRVYVLQRLLGSFKASPPQELNNQFTACISQKMQLTARICIINMRHVWLQKIDKQGRNNVPTVRSIVRKYIHYNKAVFPSGRSSMQSKSIKDRADDQGTSRSVRLTAQTWIWWNVELYSHWVQLISQLCWAGSVLVSWSRPDFLPRSGGFFWPPGTSS